MAVNWENWLESGVEAWVRHQATEKGKPPMRWEYPVSQKNLEEPLKVQIKDLPTWVTSKWFLLEQTVPRNTEPACLQGKTLYHLSADSCVFHVLASPHPLSHSVRSKVPWPGLCSCVCNSCYQDLDVSVSGYYSSIQSKVFAKLLKLAI